MPEPNILSQEEFNQYIRKLSPKQECQFMISRGINLCSQDRFKCPYKGKESYSTSKGQKRECKREETLKYKKILGQ